MTFNIREHYATKPYHDAAFKYLSKQTSNVEYDCLTKTSK